MEPISDSPPTNVIHTPGSLLAQTPEGHFRSGMLRRFGPLYYLSGLGLLLRRMRLADHSADHIRRASEEGQLVYVLHTQSITDWLALNRVLNARRLPLARFTNGIHSTRFAPAIDGLVDLWTAMVRRLRGQVPVEPVGSGWLTDAVAQGVPTALFLVQPREWVGIRASSAPDPVAALVEAQAQSSKPLNLVPIVVAWRLAPEPARTEVGRFLMGSGDEPGPILKLLSVAGQHSQALVQAGEPVNLKALLERYKDETTTRQVRAVRILLRRYLYRETHLIRGPRIRPYRWTRRLVTTSPEIQRLVDREALASGRSEEQVRREVNDTLEHIAARFAYPAVRFAGAICRFLWERIYQGVDLPDEDVARLRRVFREGTPILVPCHRSHLDYLLVSSQLYERDIVIPHVVAGENLAFWPIGPMLRRCGAFYIKRSFKGDRIFPAVFGRYVKQLIRDGFPLEFFIEGGRSRTGKLLPPKFGVLEMMLNAAQEGRDDRQPIFVPIGVSYERVAEEGAYVRELTGGEKKKETFWQFLRASSVMNKRYGKVYLRIGEPLPASELLAQSEQPWSELDRDHRKEILQQTGERILFGISRNMVVLPTGVVAMALLAQSLRGIRETSLRQRVERLVNLLVGVGALTAPSLHNTSSTDQALRQFESGKLINRLEDEAGGIFQVFEDKRITLEFYKNSLIHYVAPVSLLAAAVAAHPKEAPDGFEVFQAFRTQIFLLRYEFTLNPQLPVEQLAAESYDTLVDYGALSRSTRGKLKRADEDRLRELAGLTRNFLESYSLVLRASQVLSNQDITMSDLPKRVYEVGRGLLAVDELRRPEALSMANLKNAVSAYREEGVLLVRSDGGGLQVDEAALAQYLGDLSRLLGQA